MLQMVLKMGLKTTFEKKGVVKCRRQRENDRNWGYCEMREKISGLSPHASLSPASGYSWDSSGLESHILHVAVALPLEPWFQCLSEESVLAAVYHTRIQKHAQGMLWEKQSYLLIFLCSVYMEH